MALFGSEMTTVTTPDGRTITLPQQLAAQFPGLQPMPSQVAQSPALPVAPPAPQDTAPAPDTAAAAPVTTPSQVEPSGPQAPRGPVSNPAQATDAGPPNTPAPVTNDQLAKMGVAGGVNAELAANDAQRAAIQQQGQALANQAEKVGASMHASEQEADRLLEARRQAAEANARDMQTRTDSYLREAKKVADTKIDRSVDHPILAAIGVALGGVGGAMLQKQYGGQLTNPGLDALYKAIDRKVAGQVQDLDQKRQGLATQRDALGMQRQSGMDRLHDMDTYRLGYLEQAKRQIETIKQQTTSDVVRANADVALGGLQQEAAKTVSGAQARWQTQHDAEVARKQALQMHRESIGVQIRGQDLQQKQHDADRAERSQEKLDSIAAQIALAKGKAGEDQAKLVREAGLADPRTGDPILTEAGQKKLDDANQAEAQARGAKTPEQAKKLNEYAATLRQSAQLNDVATARDAKDRGDVQHVLNASTDFTDLANRTVAQLEAGPSAFNRESWAALKADLETLKARYVATLGERVSVRALEAFAGVTSIDPESMFSRAVDQGKAIAALKALNQDTAAYANSSLKGAGIKAKWKPGRDEEQHSFAGATSQEAGQDARPGLLSNTAASIRDTAGAITHPLDAASPDSKYFNRNPETEAENAALGRTNAQGKVNSYGLDPAVNEKVGSLIEESGSVGHKRYADIVKVLADPLTTDRPGMTYGVARQIRDADPKLYADVIAQLGPERAKEIEGNLSVSAATPPTGGYRQRSLADLSDEERAQLTEQRRAKSTEEERKKYRKAYDERAAKGTIVRGE